MRGVKVVVAIVAGMIVVALLAAAGFGFWVWRHPLAAFEASSRRQLTGAGFSQQAVATDAGRQVYFVAGEGPLLVLLHGAGDQAGSWAKVAPDLARAYRVVIVDLAGHGGSAPESGPISVVTVRDGVAAVLDEVGGGDPITIVGNSLGAWIGSLLALERPEQIERLVLVNGGPLRGVRDDLSLMPADRAEARALLAELRDPSANPVPGFVVDDIVRTAASGPIARIAATAGEMGPYLLDGRLDEITVPVDLVWGTSDQLFPMEYAQTLRRGLPRARLWRVERCGHVPHQECPGRFLSVLEEVLRTAPVEPVAEVNGTSVEG